VGSRLWRQGGSSRRARQQASPRQKQGGSRRSSSRRSSSRRSSSSRISQMGKRARRGDSSKRAPTQAPAVTAAMRQKKGQGRQATPPTVQLAQQAQRVA
jgi:hypothetical protein